MGREEGHQQRVVRICGVVYTHTVQDETCHAGMRTTTGGVIADPQHI